MPEGKHNLHLRFANEFNKLAEDFLLGKHTWEQQGPGDSLLWGSSLLLP